MAVALLAAGTAPALADDAASISLIEILKAKGILDDASYSEIKNAGSPQAADQKLLDILHAKGIIDDTNYQKLSDQAKAAPVPAAPAPAPAPVASSSADRPMDKALSSLEEGFARLTGDTVKMRIGSWFQFGYTNDDTRLPGGAQVPFQGASTPSNTSNTFYSRFMRIYFNSTLTDKMGFRIMLDATSSTSTLRDAFVWFDYIPKTRVTVGQFVTPFGDDSWHAPFELPLINYAMSTTLMQWSNFRDMGVMASYKDSGKLGDGLPIGGGVSMALINGNGWNTADNNSRKDFLGRAYINPLVPGLTVGGSWYMGKTRPNQVVGDKNNDRFGVDFDYAPAYAKGLQLRGEYLKARKYYNTVGRIAQSEGWYVSGAYRLNNLGLPAFAGNLEPVARYECLDEDLSTQTAAARQSSRTDTTIGVNYWLNKYSRLMFNYEMVSAQRGLQTTNMLTSDSVGHRVFTTNMQIWF
jgi:hypothetical protein